MIGDVEVVGLVDGVGSFARYASAFPDVPVEAWEEYRQRFPDLFDGDLWRLPFTCYLVRAGAATLLVDTGIGPSGSWDWEPEEEAMLPELVDPADVDTVFITHVHVDHVGWNTDAAGAPFFPNARYLINREALAAAHRQRERPHVQRCILPIDFEEIEGESELAPDVVAFPLPGHAAGHMGVRIGDEAVLIADAAVHPALLEHPEWRYESDRDYEQSVRTRRELVPQLEDKIVVCGHYPSGGVGRVRDGRWEPGL